MLKNSMNQPSILEITVISAQDLKVSSFTNLFCRSRLRPFTTITTTPPPLTYRPGSATTTCCKKLSEVYKTKVDDKGGFNPTWGDKFQLPLYVTSSCYLNHSCIYLQLYTKRSFLVGHTHLGWCQIPLPDILDGLLPAGSLRHLAYQLRARDGSRGHGIVNVAVKLEGAGPMMHSQSSNTNWPQMNVSEMVTGIPVTLFPPVTDPLY